LTWISARPAAGMTPPCRSIWEASAPAENREGAARWTRCDVDLDTTRGMNVPGQIRIHVPALGKYNTAGKELYWVRARVREITQAEHNQGMRPYRSPPGCAA
jgi:hypothetical protein